MSDRDSEKGVIVITGVMAAGKSTVAQLLAERFRRGVHVRGDAFRRMIVSGREEMMPETTDEAVRQLLLRHRLAASVADGYFEAGFTVVVQDVILGAMLHEMVNYIHSRPLYVVALCPNQEEVRKREQSRPKKGYGAWTVSALDDSLRNETPKLGLWLDTSNQTPEQTVDVIMRDIWTRGIVEN
jgi:chloramphenicol 3-O-phosphotransferase